MVENVIREETKNTLSSLANNKAWGPDGFSVFFFKKAWTIVGNDIVDVSMIFLLLRESS